MIAISQTFALFILTSIAAYDLQWIKDLIEWLRKQEKFFYYLSLAISIILIILLVIGGIWPSSWSIYPEMWMLTAILWVAGLSCLFATYFGYGEDFLYAGIGYIGIGLAYGIFFAPLVLGSLGLIGLVVITTIFLSIAMFNTDIDYIEYILPIVVAVASMVLGITLMNLRLNNQIIKPGLATLAGMFEWFFALIFASNAVAIANYYIKEKRERVIGILMLGIGLISITHFILFVWDTRLSMALSYCWIASAVILIIPSLFVLFKSQWDALHKDKWSSVITSILTSVIIMIASGTKFTPGLNDFINSIIAISLSISLVLGYFVYSKKKVENTVKKGKQHISSYKGAIKSSDDDGVKICSICRGFKEFLEPKFIICQKCNAKFHLECISVWLKNLIYAQIVVKSGKIKKRNERK
ncbi:MAG: E3 ubiquitin protein ligase [Candidatus Helarchaeota archaeon]|nr:E3 ubiquitin protein ligase [Candidatus Helarchaeota archaeon]